jgi:hypothetical protein
MKVREWQNTVPLRVSSEAVKHLSLLHRFDGIPDEALIRLAKLRTKVLVADRWGAIAVLVNNPCPLPVPDLEKQPQKQPRWQVRETTAPAKLEVITGGRIPTESTESLRINRLFQKSSRD